MHTIAWQEGIVAKTVWATWNGNEWVATRLSGEIVASHKYHEELLKALRMLASNPSNDILAIASVSAPLARKPKCNKPRTPLRPR